MCASNKLLCRVAQKIGTQFLYALTLPIFNRFSKLFHCQNQEKICNKLWCESTTNPVPVLRIAASRCFSELNRNVTSSSGGHSTPSVKISRKSVQSFSRNLANKETKKERKKETNKQRNRSKTIPLPPIYRGRGNNAITKDPTTHQVCRYTTL